MPLLQFVIFYIWKLVLNKFINIQHGINAYEQVTPVSKPQEVLQNTESTLAPAEATKQSTNATPVTSPPKVDFSTDLFDMLSMDDPCEKGTEASSADDGLWAGFLCMSQDLT